MRMGSSRHILLSLVDPIPKRFFFPSVADSWPRSSRISSICSKVRSREGGMVVSIFLGGKVARQITRRNIYQELPGPDVGYLREDDVSCRTILWLRGFISAYSLVRPARRAPPLGAA